MLGHHVAEMSLLCLSWRRGMVTVSVALHEGSRRSHFRTYQLLLQMHAGSQGRHSRARANDVLSRWRAESPCHSPWEWG